MLFAFVHVAVTVLPCMVFRKTIAGFCVTSACTDTNKKIFYPSGVLVSSHIRLPENFLQTFVSAELEDAKEIMLIVLFICFLLQCSRNAGSMC